MNFAVQAEPVSELAFWPQAPRGAMDASLQALIDQAVRDRLELAAKELETRATNNIYRAAWRVAAKVIRSHKPN